MTLRDLTILVIDENAIRASIIEEGLREAGHMKVTVIHEVNGVARTIETLQPDVIVIDLENPNRDMMEHLFQLTRTISRPIAMFVDRSDTASIEAAVEAGVSAYIVDGLKKERVKPILDMAVSRFKRVQPPAARIGRGEIRARRAQGRRARQRHFDEDARTFRRGSLRTAAPDGDEREKEIVRDRAKRGHGCRATDVTAATGRGAIA